MEWHLKGGTMEIEVLGFWGRRDEIVPKWIQMFIILSSDLFTPSQFPTHHSIISLLFFSLRVNYRSSDYFG